MVERLGRKGRRERIEKGSREGIEKETKRQFEEKEGLRDPPLLEFLDATLRCSHCFFKSSGYDKLELKHQHSVHLCIHFFVSHAKLNWVAFVGYLISKQKSNFSFPFK